MKELTKGEEQVMQVIWSIGQGFANEIMAAFPEPKPAYNTVLTVIKILENKGFVKHETFCRANRYSAAISKEEYSQRYLGRCGGTLLQQFLFRPRFGLRQKGEFQPRRTGSLEKSDRRSHNRRKEISHERTRINHRSSAAYRSHRWGALVGVSLFVSQQQPSVFQPLFPADKYAVGLGYALTRFALWN